MGRPNTVKPPSVLNWLVMCSAIACLIGCSDAKPEQYQLDCSTAGNSVAGLAESQRCDTITLQDDLEGSAGVPAGATVYGGNRVLTSEMGIALTVHTELGAVTHVQDLTVISGGSAAILVTGSGAAEFENIDIQMRRGVGIVYDSGGGRTQPTIQLANIEIDADRNDGTDLSYPISASDQPIVGLALARVEVDIENVVIRDVAGPGFIGYDVSGTIDQLTIENSVGIGVFLQGGHLDDHPSITIRNVARCAQNECEGASPAYGFAYVEAPYRDGQNLQAGLVVEAVDGIGVYAEGEVGINFDLDVRGSTTAGVWLQDVHQALDETIRLSGWVRDSAGAGVAAIGVRNLNLSGLFIEGTTSALLPSGVDSESEMADGIQIVDSDGSLTLDNVGIDTVTEEDAARVGLLIHGAIGENGLVLVSGVNIDGTEGNGLILQNGAAQADEWDITVAESLAANDDAFEGTMETITRIVGPWMADFDSISMVGPGGLVDVNGQIGARGAIGENGLIGTRGAIGENGLTRGD